MRWSSHCVRYWAHPFQAVFTATPGLPVTVTVHCAGWSTGNLDRAVKRTVLGSRTWPSNGGPLRAMPSTAARPASPCRGANENLHHFSSFKLGGPSSAPSWLFSGISCSRISSSGAGTKSCWCRLSEHHRIVSVVSISSQSLSTRWISSLMRSWSLWAHPGPGWWMVKPPRNQSPVCRLPSIGQMPPDVRSGSSGCMRPSVQMCRNCM
jgi:hypothetical protein